MSLALHTIKGPKRKKRKRVGRGNASGKGTYSGRGLKGQRSRSGGKSGLKMKGFKENLLRIPKLRGFKSPQPKKANIDLSDLDKHFDNGDLVTPHTLQEKGLIEDKKTGVKILSDGNLTKKLTFKDCWFSKAAEEKIVKAGGKIEREKEEKPKESKKDTNSSKKKQ